MSWEDYDGLERGGACNECGEPVEEDWHAYCASCYAERQGCAPTPKRNAEDTDMPAPAFPGDERWKVAFMQGYRKGYQDGRNARDAA